MDKDIVIIIQSRVYTDETGINIHLMIKTPYKILHIESMKFIKEFLDIVGFDRCFNIIKERIKEKLYD